MENKFEKKVILGAALIAVIPILISYCIFLNDKLNSIEARIKDNLYNAAFLIGQDKLVCDKLSSNENDLSIQKHVMPYLNKLKDVDLIVICDMDGRKYAHNDGKQIGQVFIGTDKRGVLKTPKGYYSIKKGSIGITLRRFEPIFQDKKQIGFVVVGKSYKQLEDLDRSIQITYTILFFIVLIITIIFASYFAKRIKKSMFNMEPEEIARLYNEKRIIINSISNGIIALDKDNKPVEINKSCFFMFNGLCVGSIVERLKPYLESHESFEMKEMWIQNKRVFVTLCQNMQDDKYLGAVITLIDKVGINKIAKEITGIDEVVKNLRANVHEFKNKLHVILGLINIEQYDEAKKYILQLKEVDENLNQKYANIDDFYLKAMLIGRDSMAKEEKIKFELKQNSMLYGEHNRISSDDLVTILGNLIQNSFDACIVSENKINEVSVFLSEDDEKIHIEVEDNGIRIPEYIKEYMFQRGISSKSEGHGIGLYLVKARSELYRGEIHIEEEHDKKKFIVFLFKGGNI